MDRKKRSRGRRSSDCKKESDEVPKYVDPVPELLLIGNTS